MGDRMIAVPSAKYSRLILLNADLRLMPRRLPRLAPRHILCVILLTILGSCADPQSPEEAVRSVITSMENAAEARDVGDLVEHISERYRDGYGQGRDEASRYVRGYFIANQSIHLLTRVEELDFPNEQEAHATVLVGMLGRDAGAATWDVAADVYRFKITLLREDGEWKLTYAEWVRG